MCGICGYVGDKRSELLDPMLSVMLHRGLDDAGVWHCTENEVGLGHRRLAILDLTGAGHQPMSNEAGTIWISFNGEIYNFEPLRHHLCAKGHRFRSNTDTEVLIHLYEERGLEFLHDLNGMFAIALWDGTRRRLLLARDHAGIKPLYYWQDGRRLFFASEIKALLRVPEIPRELNTEILPAYLTFLWVPGAQTMLKGIRKVEPGQYLLWEDGCVLVKDWFSLRYEPDEAASEHDWVERVHETFLRATRRQMVSDVPLGAFLSGGIDSSSVVAFMRESFPEREIRCYTVRYAEKDLACDGFVQDLPYARRVADALGVTLKAIELCSDVVSLLPKLVWHLDEPNADPAAFPSYMIAKLARQDGTTVLLSGTGGDEIFFGYRSHAAYRYFQNMRAVPRFMSGALLATSGRALTTLLGAQSTLARRVNRFRRALAKDGLERHVALVDWANPQTRRRLLKSGVRDGRDAEDVALGCISGYYNSFVGTGELNRHSHVLIHTFLAAHNFLYTDKTSMAWSVETRVPFMDLEVMRLAARIPERFKMHGGIGKFVLKQAMAGHLPPEVVNRSKTGFMAPLRKWISGDLRGLVDTLLGDDVLRRRGLFDAGAVRAIVDANLANRADHSYLIYALLALEVWQRTFIDRPGQEISLS